MDWLLCWIEGHQGLASWVQGFASVAAIWGASRLATKQARDDRATALAVVQKTKRQADTQIAEAATTLVRMAKIWLADTRADTLTDRQAIYDIATAKTHYDVAALGRFLSALEAIPLHGLPSADWVVSVLTARATLERIQRFIDNALTMHNSMDARMYTQFFASLDDMIDELGFITDDMEESVPAL